MKYCFGADVGGTTIKLGLFTVDGEILDKWEIITRTENEGESILQDIATALKEKIQEKAISAEEVIGIGMGIPAPVNSEGIVRKTANLGWGYKEVKKELENLTGWQVVVGNLKKSVVDVERKAVLNSMRLQQELQELPENISQLIRKIQYCELMI